MHNCTKKTNSTQYAPVPGWLADVAVGVEPVWWDDEVDVFRILGRVDLPNLATGEQKVEVVQPIEVQP